MVQRKIPLRRCIGCGEMLPKKELIRIVHTPEGEFVMDVTGRKNGRGAYVCPKTDCIDKAFKTKAANRSFGVNVPEETGLMLKKELSNIVKKC